MTRQISILGSTGSIGKNTLDIIDQSPPGMFQVAALTAKDNYQELARQARQYGAGFVAIANDDYYDSLKDLLADTNIQVASGQTGLIDAGAYPADITMAAITGAAGLVPTIAAVKQGNTVALANKECLVCAGDLFIDTVKSSGATLLPVDSEHNAIFQVLNQNQPETVRRLILTASGGPFLDLDASQFAAITPEMALDHPVWSMGAKISIDSATLMNKGLELIEASYLFDRPSADIDVIIHPQSVVHSMVEYIDGSVLAQMGPPDMRVPIAYALAFPNRVNVDLSPLNLTTIRELTFLQPDIVKFPALALARQALEQGGSSPNILNAANEVAVEAFLNGIIGFQTIPQLVEIVLDRLGPIMASPKDMDDVISIDAQARATANESMRGL